MRETLVVCVFASNHGFFDDAVIDPERLGMVPLKFALSACFAISGNKMRFSAVLFRFRTGGIVYR